MNTADTLTPAKHREREFLRYRESLVVDEQTWVAENLDAPLEKPLDYRYHGGELWSEQGQALGPIFADSVAHYDALAAEQPALAFQARRARAEYREYETMKAMARGEAADTLVVVSPYPRELEGATGDVLGYQAARRLGFIRVLTHEGAGRIRMWTHSIDLSDPGGIEAMYRVLGRSVDWGRDVLEQPVALDIGRPERRRSVGDELLAAYDAALSERCGGSWFAGRDVGKERREAVAFVTAQHDLLEAHVDALLHVGPKSARADQLRYDFAAAMRRRFKGDTRHRDGAEGSVAAEMASAGHEAALSGETASGCGLTVAIEQPSQAAQLQEAGYKLVPGEKKFDDCMQCPLCKTRGVLVERSGAATHYTCAGSGGCGATTKPARSAERRPDPSLPSGRSETRRPPAPARRRPVPRKAATAPRYRTEIVIGGVRRIEL